MVGSGSCDNKEHDCNNKLVKFMMVGRKIRLEIVAVCGDVAYSFGVVIRGFLTKSK